MVGISNQGGVTGANNNNTNGGGATAGSQNFGDRVLLVILKEI
jgi:hypothetical protein